MPRSRPTLLMSAALATLTLATACRGEEPPRPVPVSEGAAVPVPTYDASAGRRPALAVLALVPATASRVTVHDLEAARRQLGVPELSSVSPASERTAFWRAAERRGVVLGPVARVWPTDADAELLADYGFTSDDVDWQAVWTDDPATPASFVLSLRSDLDLSGVRRAVDDGVAGLGGATLDAEQHLLHRGTDPERPLGAVDGIRDLVPGERAASVVYTLACTPLADADADLEPLDGWSLAVADGLATVRLGLGRDDVFARAASAGDPTADPSTGRLGFTVSGRAELRALAGGGSWSACGEGQR